MLTQIAAKNAQFDREGGKKVKVAGSEDVIPCVTWDLHMDPIRLPNLPPLPELGEANESDENIVLTQIAALDNNLVGLTNKGHVLKYGNLVDETSAAGGQWEYVRFCQMNVWGQLIFQCAIAAQLQRGRKSATASNFYAYRRPHSG